jgi:hypothetical protein
MDAIAESLSGVLTVLAQMQGGDNNPVLSSDFNAMSWEEENYFFKQLPPQPDPPVNKTMLCMKPSLDFHDATGTMKRMVFWFTIPLMVISFCVLMVMVCYNCARITKFRRASNLTKAVFILLYLINVLCLAQLVFFNIV